MKVLLAADRKGKGWKVAARQRYGRMRVGGGLEHTPPMLSLEVVFCFMECMLTCANPMTLNNKGGGNKPFSWAEKLVAFSTSACEMNTQLKANMRSSKDASYRLPLVDLGRIGQDASSEALISATRSDVRSTLPPAFRPVSSLESVHVATPFYIFINIYIYIEI